MSTKVSRRTVVGLAAGMGMLPSLAHAREPGLTAHELRVEWLTDPVGLDTRRPRFRWILQAGEGARDVRPTTLRVIVASSPERLAARVGDIWDSGRRKSGKLDIAPPKDLPLASHTPYVWAVEIDGAWSAPARFVTGILDPAEWRASWIMAKPEKTRGNHVRGWSKELTDPAETAPPLLRRRFELKRAPKRAVVSVCGLGHFELTVNGAPVTASVLNPGWTAYDKTALYTTYEVESLLRPGANMLGVRLGGGMYDVEKVAGRKSKFVDSYGRPRLLLQLSLHHDDGSVEHVVSDEAWRVAEGSIVFASMFAGEDVDARRERHGWDLPSASDDGWRPALPAPDRKLRLKAQGVPPIAIHQRFETVGITEPKPGVFVYDLGQNFAGRPEMVVRGPVGSAVKLTPAEVLGDDGLAWQRSFNAGPDRWVLYNYTLAGQGGGKGEERFVPRFNYHGFRYLQVEGAVPAGRANPDGKPEIISLAGQFLYADLPQVGTFTSSDKLLERTHHLIERAVVSNAYSVLTDCPHREKLGWLEQAHLNALTVIYNRDASTMYEKMIGDIVDTQQPDGMVPGIAPEYTAFLEPDGRDQDARNSPEWGSAVVLAPWAAYRAYGDTKVLADGYPAMRRYVDYLAARAQGHIVDFGLGDWYDVGPGKLGASQLTSRALTGTATSYQALTTLARVAEVLGRPAGEVADYRERAEAIRAAFNAKFFDASTGSYDRGSQTANAMPLALGMVPKGQEGRVLEALVRAVRASQNGVTAGDVGFHYVVRALAENGRDDVVFDMMSVTDRPSYGYQLARGATALTEAWDADPTKSLNHFMLGHGEGWLFGGLAGINVDFAAAPDRVITVAPKPVGTVASAEATFRSALGPVRSAWRREGGVLALDVDVPVGARATVRLPTRVPAQARESGVPATAAKGVRSTRAVAGGLEMVVGSGRYRFTAPV